MKKWDHTDYQKIVNAFLGDHLLNVEFLNGDNVSISLESILPIGLNVDDVKSLAVSDYEINVAAEPNNFLVPWDKIRVLTDSEFAKEMASQAEENARLVGEKIKILRERKGMRANELAERAGITPQTISRIEKGHTDLNFGTLKKILAAMGYSLKDLATQEALFEQKKEVSTFSNLLKHLSKYGVESYLIKKILPKAVYNNLINNKGDLPELLTSEITLYFNRVFGWSERIFWSGEPLSLHDSPAQFAYFKTPSKGNITQIKAYSHYAYYLAGIVCKINAKEPVFEYPGDIDECKEFYFTKYSELTLYNLISFTWDLGISVIPLNDPGVFHGASWNISGNHVIVLKQRSESHARWIFDLLHELYHVFAHLEEPNTSVVEIEELNPFANSDTPEELEANSFANQFIFGKRSQEIIQECLEEANYKMEHLKRAVAKIAQKEDIREDFLANHLAFRLQLTEKNWWPTANTFQVTTPSPFSIACDIIKERIDFKGLNPIDFNLLTSAIN